MAVTRRASISCGRKWGAGDGASGGFFAELTKPTRPRQTKPKGTAGGSLVLLTRAPPLGETEQVV